MLPTATRMRTVQEKKYILWKVLLTWKWEVYITIEHFQHFPTHATDPFCHPCCWLVGARKFLNLKEGKHSPSIHLSLAEVMLGESSSIAVLQPSREVLTFLARKKTSLPNSFPTWKKIMGTLMFRALSSKKQHLAKVEASNGLCLRPEIRDSHGVMTGSWPSKKHLLTWLEPAMCNYTLNSNDANETVFFTEAYEIS